ncbi:hypothetical protein [Entomobacter blattae]|uniref:Uncharacterized protein n=1 Tax=Entomobacter blattae TaxID=2762277 RepID=A0A7H1NNT6_9PROT|nr:hypothetical protein [Entomobacter blattae]QNT77446.1 hypothetical protein JGUZn3_01810 [Entomobacter blattae]
MAGNKFFGSKKLIKKVRAALQSMDDIAFYNVTHDSNGQSILNLQGVPIPGKFPCGGPFGAAIAVSYIDLTGEDVFEIVGKRWGNNVVASGIASEHAEDQAMQPDNYKALQRKLSLLRSKGLTATVWQLSSGQSCPTCHTKQEIMARDLVQRGLIKKGHFKTVYGATFEETFKIAQFFDDQYSRALIAFSLSPKNRKNIISSNSINFADLPEEVMDILGSASKPTAVFVRNRQIYAIGTDERNEFDLYSTPEVTAIRKACVRNREENNVLASWEVSGELFTTTQEVGPLLFTEMGWTKASQIKHVLMPKNLQHLQYETCETPHLNNAAFLHIVAGGYTDPLAAIEVYHDKMFNNTAQPQWAEGLAVNNTMLYNGASVSDWVLDHADLAKSRFTALDLSAIEESDSI